MLKNNYHTHTRYCHHANGDVKDYVEFAISNHIEELGFTDHAPIINNMESAYGKEYLRFATNMSFDDVDDYLNDIKNAKIAYKDKIKILSGFETEFLPKGIEFYKLLRSKVDYLILGVHYFEHDNGLISTFNKEEITSDVLHDYATSCIKGMESGLYNVLAHPDLFMYHYHNKNGLREFDETAIKESRRIIEASIKNNVYLELNANGLRQDGYLKKYTEWNYPYYRFWEIVKEYKDAKIIIGADAHDPKNLANENVKATIEFAKKLGLNVASHMEINH